MQAVELAPDQVFYLRRSSNGNPPDREHVGQHTNCSTLWASVVPNGPWRLVWHHRSSHKAAAAVISCKSVGEALDLLCGKADQ
jgi:hypothetical protein